MSRDGIIDGMTQAIWASSYADYVESLTKSERGSVGAPVNLDGVDWYGNSPEPPEAVDGASRELVAMYESENGASIEDLERRAHAADDEELGRHLAEMAMGTGSSWFDDHARFELAVPLLEAYYDGEFFEWSGRCKTTMQNPAGSKLKNIFLKREKNGWHVDAQFPKQTLNYGPFKTKERGMRMREAVIESDLQRNPPTRQKISVDQTYAPRDLIIQSLARIARGELEDRGIQVYRKKPVFFRVPGEYGIDPDKVTTVRRVPPSEYLVVDGYDLYVEQLLGGKRSVEAAVLSYDEELEWIETEPNFIPAPTRYGGLEEFPVDVAALARGEAGKTVGNPPSKRRLAQSMAYRRPETERPVPGERHTVVGTDQDGRPYAYNTDTGMGYAIHDEHPFLVAARGQAGYGRAQRGHAEARSDRETRARRESGEYERYKREAEEKWRQVRESEQRARERESAEAQERKEREARARETEEAWRRAQEQARERVNGYPIVDFIETGERYGTSGRKGRYILVDRGDRSLHRWVTAHHWEGDTSWDHGNYFDDLGKAKADLQARAAAKKQQYKQYKQQYKPPPPPKKPGSDPRSVLGFAPGERLTTDMVKKRHRELARQHHPDVGGETAKMQEINIAVDTLMASGQVYGSNPGPARTWPWR